jgi:ribose 5-phosphate isomerase A
VIIVVDETKMTPCLGHHQVVPIEVLPFAEQYLFQRLAKRAKRIVRRVTSSSQPYITDNHHHILDVDFGEINDPESLEKTIQNLPGVIETGLFVDMADIICVGTQTTVEIQHKSRARE